MTLALAPSLHHGGVSPYVALFEQCFGGDAKLSPAYIEWQYLRNPEGRVIGTDAMDGERLAAHYAVIPRSFQHGRERISGALSVNTATHPAYQGQGLFVRLAERTYATAAEQGIRFVIGVANNRSVGGFVRRLGFTALGSVRLGLGLPPRPEPLEALATLRSTAWWHWRLQNPSRRYRLAGASLQTRAYGVPFNVATIGSMDGMPHVPRRAAILSRLALTPIFPWTTGRSAVLMRLQPSPWHVIIRALDGRPVTEYAQYLTFWGIDMDTF